MPQWDLAPFSVTPAASVLARCVSRGALAQEELDSASSGPRPAFSTNLHEAELRIKKQRQLDQLQLEMQLLQVEKQDADITHSFYLTQRFQMLQMFCGHLQDVLKDQTSLRQRLMRPLGRTNLPVQAHLHGSVVDSVKLLLGFIETLEEKLKSVHSLSEVRDHLSHLDTSLAQLLAQVVELQTLSQQVLKWREVGSSLQADSSA